MRVRNLILGVVLGASFIACKKEKNRICELYDGAVEYSVGRIDSYKSIPGKVTYIYSYEVDGNNYDGKEKAYGIGQKDATLIGKSFIVVYALGNPSNTPLGLASRYVVKVAASLPQLKATSSL